VENPEIFRGRGATFVVDIPLNHVRHSQMVTGCALLNHFFKKDPLAIRAVAQVLGVQSPSNLMVLLMDKILHHLGWFISHYLWGFVYANWCRIFSINSIFTIRS